MMMTAAAPPTITHLLRLLFGFCLFCKSASMSTLVRHVTRDESPERSELSLTYGCSLLLSRLQAYPHQGLFAASSALMVTSLATLTAGWKASLIISRDIELVVACGYAYPCHSTLVGAVPICAAPIYMIHVSGQEHEHSSSGSWCLCR